MYHRHFARLIDAAYDRHGAAGGSKLDGIFKYVPENLEQTDDVRVRYYFFVWYVQDKGQILGRKFGF